MAGDARVPARPRGWLGHAAAALASVLLPAGCRICDQLMPHASRVPICDECLASFEPLPRKVCESCGSPQRAFNIQEDSRYLCPACQNKTYAFHRARSFAFYDRAMVRAILLLKFERMEPLAAWFAARLAEKVAQEGELLRADVIVPVPLHRLRQKERGYNQADLIARALAKRLRLPREPVLLMRTRPRPDKRVLSLEERWASVRGAFATRPGSQVDNRRVLLVDDVMTTGATLDACSRALREAGAKTVLGLTVARALRDSWAGTGEEDPRNAQ